LDLRVSKAHIIFGKRKLKINNMMVHKCFLNENKIKLIIKNDDIKNVHTSLHIKMHKFDKFIGDGFMNKIYNEKII